MKNSVLLITGWTWVASKEHAMSNELPAVNLSDTKSKWAQVVLKRNFLGSTGDQGVGAG